MERPTNQLAEWEWIEQYWSGRLSPEERTFFEEIMKKDVRFAEEVESLRNGVSLLDTVRTKQHIQQTLRRLHEMDRRNAQIRIRWLTASGILAAACAGFLLILSFQSIRLPGYENDWEIIRDLRNDYRTDSTDHFSLRRKQVFDLFFEAQALLSEGQPSSAAQRFEQILTYSNLRPYFREAAQWHLIVCYLRAGQGQKARAVYNQVRNSTNYEIDWLSRWQIQWQIQLENWFGSGRTEQKNTTHNPDEGQNNDHKQKPVRA